MDLVLIVSFHGFEPVSDPLLLAALKNSPGRQSAERGSAVGARSLCPLTRAAGSTAAIVAFRRLLIYVVCVRCAARHDTSPGWLHCTAGEGRILKVLLVNAHGDPAVGGTEKHVADLARELTGRGHEVSFLQAFPDAGPSGVRRRSSRRALEALALERGQASAQLHVEAVIVPSVGRCATSSHDSGRTSSTPTTCRGWRRGYGRTAGVCAFRWCTRFTTTTSSVLESR